MVKRLVWVHQEWQCMQHISIRCSLSHTVLNTDALHLSWRLRGIRFGILPLNPSDGIEKERNRNSKHSAVWGTHVDFPSEHPEALCDNPADLLCRCYAELQSCTPAVPQMPEVYICSLHKPGNKYFRLCGAATALLWGSVFGYKKPPLTGGTATAWANTLSACAQVGGKKTGSDKDLTGQIKIDHAVA